MASVEKRKDGRPGYVVRWRDESGRQRKKSFARRVDADRYRAEVAHSLNTGAYVDPKGGRRTFRDCAEEVRLALPHRPNTAARWKSTLTKHVYPVFGEKPIGAFRTTMLQGFATSLAEHMAPRSVRVHMAVVNTVFTAMVRDRVIGSNPCAGIDLPEVEDDEVNPLTVGQVEVLCEQIDPRYRGLVVVGSGLGHRQGEAFGMEVPDIDFMRRRQVRIERQVQPAKGGAEVVRLKNKASNRNVPAADVVLTELAAHLKAYPPIEVDVVDRTGPKPVTRKARFVFATPDGRPLAREWFNRRVWEPARAAAAEVFRKRAADEQDQERAAELLRQAAQLAECGFHDLRHFFASALIRANLNVKVVASRLGHANPTMTLKVYAHLWVDDEDRTRDAINAVFGADVPRLRPAKEA